jgi:cobalt-zinc-cadmium efflux system protein
MTHDHDSHTPSANLGRAFALGIALNLAFVIVEAVYGLLADSVALLADAAHNSSDVLGLVLAWGASLLAKRKPSRRHTYGLRSTTLLAALANASLLLVAVGGVAWEAIGRFRNPSPTNGLTVLAVAAVGVLINGGAALLFRGHGTRDVNVRAAFMHLAADAAVSLGVVIAGAAMWRTSWFWLDPAVSLAISAVVLIGTWGLFRQALHLTMAGVPNEIDLGDVNAYLRSLPEVCDVHDLHIWAMSTTEVALTAHLVMRWTAEPPKFLPSLDRELQERFGIHHSTVQIEPMGATEACRQASDDQV